MKKRHNIYYMILKDFYTDTILDTITLFVLDGKLTKNLLYKGGSNIRPEILTEKEMEDAFFNEKEGK